MWLGGKAVFMNTPCQRRFPVQNCGKPQFSSSPPGFVVDQVALPAWNQAVDCGGGSVPPSVRNGRRTTEAEAVGIFIGPVQQVMFAFGT